MLHELWWNAVKKDLLIDRNAFMVEAAEWGVDPVMVGCDIAALVIQKDSEVHFIKLGNHPFTRALIRPVMRVGMTTRVPMGDAVNRAFVRRMGFNYTGTDGADCFYKLERLRHV